MKKLTLSLLIALFFFTTQAADTLHLSSPDKQVRVNAWCSNGLYYQVFYNNNCIVMPSLIDMQLSNGNALGRNNAVASAKTGAINTQIISPVPEKRKLIPDVYNELTVILKQPFTVIFRAYNDGIAYRIQTRLKDSIIVKSETAIFNFPQNHPVYFPQIGKREDADSFHTSFEELYPLKPLDSISNNVMAFTPVLVAPETSPRIAVTESDLLDYPGMFLKGNNNNSLHGVWAPYPLEEKVVGEGFSQKIVSKRADFIARTAGTRSFPWRVLLIAKEDKELPSNDLVYRLASPSKLQDVSWVHPGKCTDEWTIGINLFNVPFKTGINTASYKYYIDFVKRFGFDRIMMDAGWSDSKDLFKINPNINMDTLAAYAKEKGVKISMWTLAMTLDRQLDSALKQFDKWGVDFIMTDFIDRDDQPVVNFYERIAKACAAHKMMIMYHGAYPPKGFNRTYPNAITRESVLGSEYNIWSYKPSPDHDLILPFTRMLSGPLDYEPGILDNATKKTFRPIEEKVMSQGTRCHQLAMFVVYDSPIQIFSGNPSQGLLEPRFMELLGSLPTTWDETKIVDAKVGGYIVTARKKGDNWYIAGMSNWNERDLGIPLDFLGNGNYTMTICKDGVNADRYPSDYIINSGTATKEQTIQMHLAPGGGFLIKLVKQ